MSVYQLSLTSNPVTSQGGNNTQKSHSYGHRYTHNPYNTGRCSRVNQQFKKTLDKDNFDQLACGNYHDSYTPSCLETYTPQDFIQSQKQAPLLFTPPPIVDGESTSKKNSAYFNKYLDCFYEELSKYRGINEVNKEWLLDKLIKFLVEGQISQSCLAAPDFPLEKFILTLEKTLYWHQEGHLQDPNLPYLVFRLFQSFCEKEQFSRLSTAAIIRSIAIFGYASNQNTELLKLFPVALKEFQSHFENQANSSDVHLHIQNLIIAISRLDAKEVEMADLFLILTQFIKKLKLPSEFIWHRDVKKALALYDSKESTLKTSEASEFFNRLRELLRQFSQEKVLAQWPSSETTSALELPDSSIQSVALSQLSIPNPMSSISKVAQTQTSHSTTEENANFDFLPRLGRFYNKLDEKGGASNVGKEWLNQYSINLLNGFKQVWDAPVNKESLDNGLILLEKMFYWDLKGWGGSKKISDEISRHLSHYCDEAILGSLSIESLVRLISFFRCIKSHKFEAFLERLPALTKRLGELLKDCKTIKKYQVTNLILGLLELDGKEPSEKCLFQIFTPILASIERIPAGIYGHSAIKSRLSNQPQNAQDKTVEALEFCKTVKGLLERWETL